jgi:hypothetical protein
VEIEAVTAEPYRFDISIAVENRQGIAALENADSVVHDRRRGPNVVLTFDFDNVRQRLSCARRKYGWRGLRPDQFTVGAFIIPSHTASREACFKIEPARNSAQIGKVSDRDDC